VRGYTDEEIRGASEGLMITRTRFPVDPRGGTRAVEVTFSDIQEATASVFLLNHDALFYLASLSAKRLRYDVDAYRRSVQRVHDLVGTLGRTPVPVDNVAPLEDARAALLQLEAVSGTSRATGVGTAPAYLRFRQKVDEFLSSVRGNVVQGGDVVPSMREARVLISGLVSTLPDMHAGVVERLGLISGLQGAYASLELPHVMLAGTVSKARKLVGYKAYRIKNQTEEQNQEEIRGTVLDLLAAKAVMRRAAMFTEPELDRGATGTAVPYADSDKEATPAVAQTIDGPFDIRATSGTGAGLSTLVFAFDGSSDTYEIGIPSVIEIVQMDGSSPGPFEFITSDTVAELVSDAIGAPTLAAGMQLVLYLSYRDGVDIKTKTVSTAFTPGVSSAILMAADIQAALVAAGVGSHFSAAGGTGRVVVQAATAGSSFYIQVVKMSDEVVDVLGQHWVGVLGRGRDVNNILNIRTGSSASPVEQYFTFLAGVFTADEVVARINSTKPPSFPIEASAPYVAYATPPYQVVRIKYTGTAADAVLEILPTYDPGGGDQPAGAYKELHLRGALDRQTARTSALTLYDILAQHVDSVTGQTEIFNRTDMGVDGDRLTIASRGTGVSSRVGISGDGCQPFFGATSVERHGSTGWLEMSDDNEIAEGDTVNAAGSGVYLVDAVDGAHVHLSTELGVNHPAIDCDAGSSVTHGKKETRDTRSSDIDTWLGAWGSVPSYTIELNRLLSIVLAGKNPTSGDINDAQAHLQSLLTALDDIYSVLEGHVVERAEELDDVIRTYREKGCERAVALLLECRLADFFGLGAEEASYAGRMLKASKAVARNDMPVSKDDRRSSNNRLMARVPSPDYETDLSDSEDNDMTDDDHFAIDAD